MMRTNKRFEIIRVAECNPAIYDNLKDDLLSLSDAVHLLNTLQEELNLLRFDKFRDNQKVQFRPKVYKEDLRKLGGIDYLRKLKEELGTIERTSRKIGCSKTLIFTYLKKEHNITWSEL